MVNKARVFFPDTMIKVNITFASKAKILPLEFSKGYQSYKSSFYLSLSFFQKDLFCQTKLYRIDRLYKTLKVGADPYSQININLEISAMDKHTSFFNICTLQQTKKYKLFVLLANIRPA